MKGSNHVQWFTITGALSGPSFVPWVLRHGKRLGLDCAAVETGPSRTVFRVEGQPDLIDALEVGCLLGPIDIWVETIERHISPPLA